MKVQEGICGYMSPVTAGPRAGLAPSPCPPATAPALALVAVAVPAARALITSAETTRPPGPVPVMFLGVRGGRGDEEVRGETEGRERGRGQTTGVRIGGDIEQGGRVG